ncbi:hypothetical protein GT348_07080 [Aristophania vespae]|uniref:TtsA-like Glycoside hydrolase family 108 domain-containing protein n=1 Tax=Aristophania vespae TaxID=2697033 RepID=A0A6P1NCI7_9PROT|nr:glycosyl hydrolase 108 family protein [Aristophania vespae]QHI96026.1 hypothetical protein GT348_07080 [Aristophania vespae]
MRTSLEQTLNFTIESEGGYQCLRSDPGNWTGGRVGCGELVGTKYGLSAPIVGQEIEALTARKMRLLDEADFERIATEQFWNPMRCDDLPVGLDLLTFDHGFNTGPGSSVKLLQRVAGVKTDGIMGPATLKAIKSASVAQLGPYLNRTSILCLQKSLMLDETGVMNAQTRRAISAEKNHNLLWVSALSSMQDVDYRQKSGFSTFGRGWLNRVQKRTEKALELCREHQTDKIRAA